MQKTYLVQTWDDAGALTNNYEVKIESPTQLRELTKFLKQKAAHVAITQQPAARAAAPAKRKR